MHFLEKPEDSSSVPGFSHSITSALFVQLTKENKPRKQENVESMLKRRQIVPLVPNLFFLRVNFIQAFIIFKFPQFSWPKRVSAKYHGQCWYEQWSHNECVQQNTNGCNGAKMNKYFKRHHSYYCECSSEHQPCGTDDTASFCYTLSDRIHQRHHFSFGPQARHKENTIADSECDKKNKRIKWDKSQNGRYIKDVMQHNPAKPN